jgi:hypothetical protein
LRSVSRNAGSAQGVPAMPAQALAHLLCVCVGPAGHITGSSWKRTSQW